MNDFKVYLAVDLGAGSGRVIAGEFDGTRIRLNELHRFENTPLELPDGWHWNTTSLFQCILDGLRVAASRYGSRAVSVGVDSWGVDFGYVDASGRLLGLPYQYRDGRTKGMIERACSLMPKREIYERTGLQFMFFNTLFQLLGEQATGSQIQNAASRLLFTPDLFSFWLSGEKVQEHTISSTSQLYNPRTRDWDRELVSRMGISPALFGPLTESGTPLGSLRSPVREATGLGSSMKVVTVCGHDTASAVAAVPSRSAITAYISSGTWSLMGLELPEPVINDRSFADEVSHEMGMGGRIRFQKNLCGLWLVQESRRHWQKNGLDIGYGQMENLAAEAPAFRSLINPDHPRFVEAGRMPEKIAEFCRETGQPVPSTPGETIRCIYESLALSYSRMWSLMKTYTPAPLDKLHIMGGGSQSRTLNQFTANAIGAEVSAGPVEATALGSILSQMLADGSIKTLAEGRQIVQASFPTDNFTPQNQSAWSAAFEKFTTLSVA